MSGLESLIPKEPHLVIDLVREAGVDVSGWAQGSVGEVNPSTNPKYCYEWAFIQDNKVVVLNLWHKDLKEENGVICQRLNPRQYAEEYRDSRKRGGVPARALRMDSVLQSAFKLGIPVRVIILDGRSTWKPKEQVERLEVRARMLDDAVWAVTAYDEQTGACVVTRGAISAPYQDQFSVLSHPTLPTERKEVTTHVYDRREDVRRSVLMRAGGRCEWCGGAGFKTVNGLIYLETHHVVPLSEGGTDSANNVVAVCPNHHREAHYGETRKQMRTQLLLIADRT